MLFHSQKFRIETPRFSPPDITAESFESRLQGLRHRPPQLKDIGSEVHQGLRHRPPQLKDIGSEVHQSIAYATVCYHICVVVLIELIKLRDK